MIIKAIKVSSCGGEFTLISDDNEKYTVSLADAKRLGFENGIDEELPILIDDEERLIFMSQKLKAVKYCTYLLGFSDKSESALKRKLREKQYTAEVIDAALEILADGGITNDGMLCLRKLVSLASTKLYGPVRLKGALFEKGFDSETIKYAFEEADIDFEHNLSLLIEKLASQQNIDFSDRASVEKFKAKLARYGYSFNQISSVLKDFD